MTNQSIIRSAVEFIPNYYSITNNNIVKFSDGNKRINAMPLLNIQ